MQGMIYVHMDSPFNIGETASQASLVISHNSVRGLSEALSAKGKLLLAIRTGLKASALHANKKTIKE